MVNMIISMFIKAEILPSLDSDVEASHFYSERRPHGEVSKASICDLRCPRSTWRCLRLVLAQCIRYLRCCVKHIPSIFELNDLCCLGDCSVRHRYT